MAAILDAKDNLITRPVDAAKLARRPQALKAAIGPVTVPDMAGPPNRERLLAEQYVMLPAPRGGRRGRRR